MRISTIIAVKNTVGTLERCLRSVIGQTHPDKEILVIDGASSDGSLDIIREKKDHLDYVFSGPDTGVYQAWNRALPHITGDWVTFIGADDYFWDEQVLARLVPHLASAAQERVDIVYGEARKIDTLTGRIVKATGAPWPRLRWQLRHGMPFIHSGMMHHRPIFERYGGFDETFQIAGDYEMLLRVLLAAEARFASGVVAVAHAGGGLSDRHKIALMLEIQRARRQHGLSRFSWLWCALFCRESLKKFYNDHRRRGR